jgi:hypothetical protein
MLLLVLAHKYHAKAERDLNSPVRLIWMDWCNKVVLSSDNAFWL